jgi:hypothetical protein
MQPDFDAQLRRLLQRYANDVRPTRDVLSHVRLRLSSQDTDQPARPHRRVVAFPVIVTATAVVLVALFGALFVAHVGGLGSAPGSCVPTSPPTPSTESVGGIPQVTHAYVGDDFISLDMQWTGSNVSPLDIGTLPIQYYVRDTSGQYVANNGGTSWLGRNNQSAYYGTVEFPSFAHASPPGEDTFYLGWIPGNAGNAPSRSVVHEVAFKATATTGDVLQPAVTPATNGKLTLELVDMTINRTTNPVLTPSVESIRLHLRMNGLPPAPACNTLVIDSFHSAGGPIIKHQFSSDGGPGGFVNGDNSTLSFPDGISGLPVWADNAGRKYFAGGPPAVYASELEPGEPGAMDIVAVFYAPNIPHAGTVTFAVNELHATYVWGAVFSSGPNRHTEDHTYSGPWTLTIPLS